MTSCHQKKENTDSLYNQGFCSLWIIRSFFKKMFGLKCNQLESFTLAQQREVEISMKSS